MLNQGFKIFALLFFLVSCQSSNPDEFPIEDRGYGYFPLFAGQEIKYKVTRVEYFLQLDTAQGSVVTVADTSCFFLRKSMILGPDDPSGNQSFINYLYTKRNIDDSWPSQPDSLETVENTTVDLLSSRNNKTFTELKFPVIGGSSWDGNSFNTMNPRIFSYDSTNFEFMISDSITFSPCLRVLKSDIKNAIEIDRIWEIYGNGIGSLQKSIEKIRFKQVPGADTLGLQGIEGGIYEYWEYTNEG